MELIYRETVTITPLHTDCFGRIKPSTILFLAQEAAGSHCQVLGTDWDTLQKQNLFWALIRTKVEISHLPTLGQTITIETWPMPQTRTAYPRCTVAYDETGRECFRILALWVLMDTQSRSMVLPGKSGIAVPGILRENEPDAPKALPAFESELCCTKTVGYGELDRNGHMNNTRYLDWVMDLVDSGWHKAHPVRQFTVCYMAEAMENQNVILHYRWENDILQVDGHREKTDVCAEKQRIFAANVSFL